MFEWKLFVFDSFEAGEDLSAGIDKETMASIEADVLKLSNSPRPFVHIEEMGTVIDWTFAIETLSEVLQREQLLDLFHQGIHIEAAERGRVPVIKSFPPNQPTLKDLATLAAALIGEEEDTEDFEEDEACEEDVCLWCYADHRAKDLGLLLCEFPDSVLESEYIELIRLVSMRDLRVEDLPYIEGLSRYAGKSDEDFAYTLSLEQGVLGSRNTQRFLGRS